MSGVNKVILVGNLGKDPEMRYTPGGTAVCSFSIATSETYTKDGEKVTDTEWHNIVTFNKLAEICGEYLVKGKQVYLEGKLKTSSWEDKEGNTKYKTEIVCHQMQMLGSRGEDAPRAEIPAPAPEAQGQPDFEDIPF